MSGDESRDESRWPRSSSCSRRSPRCSRPTCGPGRTRCGRVTRATPSRLRLRVGTPRRRCPASRRAARGRRRRCRAAGDPALPSHLRVHGTLDTAAGRRQGARAQAELALADLARSRDPRRAAQASDLLGVLAFSDLASGGGANPDQADRARVRIRRTPSASTRPTTPRRSTSSSCCACSARTGCVPARPRGRAGTVRAGAAPARGSPGAATSARPSSRPLGGLVGARRRVPARCLPRRLAPRRARPLGARSRGAVPRAARVDARRGARGRAAAARARGDAAGLADERGAPRPRRRAGLRRDRHAPARCSPPRDPGRRRGSSAPRPTRSRSATRFRTSPPAWAR